MTRTKCCMPHKYSTITFKKYSMYKYFRDILSCTLYNLTFFSLAKVGSDLKFSLNYWYWWQGTPSVCLQLLYSFLVCINSEFYLLSMCITLHLWIIEAHLPNFSALSCCKSWMCNDRSCKTQQIFLFSFYLLGRGKEYLVSGPGMCG